MPDATPILSLPLILPAQAQKHVTHNEALLLLDILAQLVVLDRNRTAPPASPVEGDVHIVAAAATGDWAGQSGAIAAWWQGVWTFIPPREGWRAWDLDRDEEVVFDAGQWSGASDRGLRVDRLGVNAAADTTNRLSVTAPATLLNHAGAGHQLKLNKAAAAETASLLYQTAFSGRAEMGLAGSDDFSVKVSPDGTAWTTALSVNRTSGQVSLPAGAAVTNAVVTGAVVTGAVMTGTVVNGTLTGTAITQTNTDTTPGRITKVGDFGLGAFATPDVDPNATDLPTRLFRSNAPIAALGGATGHILHVSRVQNAQGAQIAVRDVGAATPPLAAFRHRDSTGAWSDWSVLYARRNLLGAVSQASGIPTGAVIERGLNANGEFVRFADGTQICTRTNLSAANANTALGSLFRSADVAWTFPATFAAAPAVSGDVDDADAWMVTSSAPGTSSANLRVLAAVTKGTALNFRAMAIGRWF